MSQYSAIVSEGMKRICRDFSERVAPRGFVATKSRTWVRQNEWTAESIYFFRHGSSYGAPRNASVDIRVHLDIHILNSPAGSGIGIISDPLRRSTGYAYHHRFNAHTGSTYDRCLEELDFFVTEFADPWFAKWREPAQLLSNPDLKAESRAALAMAMAGEEDSANITATLKRLGVKGGPMGRRSTV